MIQEINPTEDNNAAMGSRHCNILVVDDEAALTRLTAEILRKQGHQVETALNAADALDKIKNNNFDILISDVMMPGLNGFMLADKVKQQYPNIKIIIVSGYNDHVNNDKITQSYDEQLAKPVSRMQLLEAIDTVLS